jgi:hypothetical protein
VQLVVAAKSTKRQESQKEDGHLHYFNLHDYYMSAVCELLQPRQL